MKKDYRIPYREEDHGDFNAEWPPHKKVSGWWYITGYLSDPEHPKHIYSYQYTLLRARIYGVTVTVLQLAFTDFQTGQHFFKQQFSFRERKFFEGENSLQFPPLAHLQKGADDINLTVQTDDFSLNLNLDYGKGAFWHEESYQIRPIMDGQMNLAYFELLAEIITPSGESVGYCFVELLPGVRNPGKKIGFKKLFERV